MLGKISSALGLKQTLAADHHDPGRASTYVTLASELKAHGVPVSQSDCYTCAEPCPDDEQLIAGTVAEAGVTWDGRKPYDDYVLDTYGDLGELPAGFDTDWESELAGSAAGGRGRVVVVSTGKSDWTRDHTDEEGSLAHHLNKYIESLPRPPQAEGGGKKGFNARPPPKDFTASAALPPPSTAAPASAATNNNTPLPSLFSSSLISQSDDPEDQTTLVFPDWKVCLEVENSPDGAKALYDAALASGLGRAGKVSADEGGTERRRSYVLPYRAVVLLCSHKKRDKRCHIAAPLLRSALHTVLAKHDISVDETGDSLSHLGGPALEEVQGGDAEREAEVGRRIEAIEGVKGGQGGEVGIFNINHLGGHRYAGVMLILFPSGAYVSYGRVTPKEIPRVVEDTILRGRLVPGLVRNAVGVKRAEGSQGCGFLGW